jgi:ribosomal protein S18 acetylase RimI-like enzyme
MVERLAARNKFKYGKITIRATRSKWGCCTSQNNLSLSLFLMTLPTHLQEFVVLHELCHTVHHNHSAEFHALLDRVTGGREKELNRQLKGIRKNLRFRKGVESDLERIMELVADAQNWFRQQGIDQWQDGYPTREIISSDILGGENYIVEHNDVASAMAVISFRGEPTYSEIKGKGWLNENRYAVVHRIAVADECRRKGIAKEILHFTEELCAERGISDIRIDTHRDNRAMRSLLKKMGYTHCGRIILTSGAFREAYHKILKSN